MSARNSLEVSTAAEVTPPSPATAAGRSVLVVEDHPAHQQMTRAVLEALGHQVTMVADGFAAVEAASATAFDVIVMDRNMPRCGGDQATTLIRTLAGPSRHALIVCHSSDPPTGGAAALYDDTLEKPATFEAVRGVLERMRARAEHP
jgi:CheY-like chemotaxis protein